MSREEINVIFEKLAVLTDGDRAAVWKVISDLKAQNPKRTPTLREVLDKLIGARSASKEKADPEASGAAVLSR